MADALTDAIHRQMRQMLDRIDNPVVLLRFMHLAAALPERSAENILALASQKPDAWMITPDSARPDVYLLKPHVAPNGVISYLPDPHRAATPYEMRGRGPAPENLQMALRALDIKPAEHSDAAARQFTREIIDRMRSLHRESYGYRILPDSLDIQAQGAAYITAVHFGADVTGAGFSGLFDPGAVSGPGSMNTLRGMSGYARQTVRQIERGVLDLKKPLAQKPAAIRTAPEKTHGVSAVRTSSFSRS